MVCNTQGTSEPGIYKKAEMIFVLSSVSSELLMFDFIAF